MVSNFYTVSFKVHARGVTLYSKVATLLQKLKNEHSDVIRVAINCGLSLPIKDFAELEELLIKEKASFEVGTLALISVIIGPT